MPKRNPKPDLLPCPFCGGDAEMREGTALHDTWLVRCVACGVKTMTEYTKACPTETWNARVAISSGKQHD